MPDAAAPMTGLDRSRRAVALAAGWPWCDEHRRARWDGADPCNHLHPKPEPAYDEAGRTGVATRRHLPMTRFMRALGVFLGILPAPPPHCPTCSCKEPF